MHLADVFEPQWHPLYTLMVAIIWDRRMQYHYIANQFIYIYSIIDL